MKKIKFNRYNGQEWEDLNVSSDWESINNKPTNYPPTAHTHDCNSITSVYDTKIRWGNAALAGELSPIGVCLNERERANRLAFLPSNRISVEYSNDGGQSWVNADNVSDDNKVALVTLKTSIQIGSAVPVTTNNRTRITITIYDGQTLAVDMALKKIEIEISNSGHGTEVLIETKKNSADSQWKEYDTYFLTGWSGNNDIPVNFYIGSCSDQIGQLRFTFGNTSVNSTYKNVLGAIHCIKFYGDHCFKAPSNLANHDHLYDYDARQNAIFPAIVKATSFNGGAADFTGKVTGSAGAVFKGRIYGTGDDEGIVIEQSPNGYATLCLGNNTGPRSVFYLNSSNQAFWRYDNGNGTYDILHPAISGTIALTSDIPTDYTRNSDNSAEGYIPKFIEASKIGNSSIKQNDENDITISGKVIIDPSSSTSVESYNEGLRIWPANNGWSEIFFSNTKTTSGKVVKGWIAGKRGSTGDISGDEGDFTIECGGNEGSGLTLYSNGSRPRWNNNELAYKNENRLEWNAVVKGNTYSRLCYVAYGKNIEGSSYIISISATRNNLVYNDTYLVKAHHHKEGNIVKLSGSKYSTSNGIKVRVVVDASGNSYFELCDNAVNISTSTTQTVHCCMIPILVGDVTKYTEFTDGTTIPTGYYIPDSITISNAVFQAESIDAYTIMEDGKLLNEKYLKITDVDSSLSSTSTKPVQNKVVQSAISTVNLLIQDLEEQEIPYINTQLSKLSDQLSRLLDFSDKTIMLSDETGEEDNVSVPTSLAAKVIAQNVVDEACGIVRQEVLYDGDIELSGSQWGEGYVLNGSMKWNDKVFKDLFLSFLFCDDAGFYNTIIAGGMSQGQFCVQIPGQTTPATIWYDILTHDNGITYLRIRSSNAPSPFYLYKITNFYTI